MRAAAVTVACAKRQRARNLRARLGQ